MEADYGSYIEIAYEWTWDEAMTYIEILDLREEMNKRSDARQKAEDRATR